MAEKHFYIRICAMCGEVFYSEARNTRYCSDGCRQKAVKYSEHKRAQKKKELALKRKMEKSTKKWHAFKSPSDYARIQKEDSVERYARIDVTGFYKEMGVTCA